MKKGFIKKTMLVAVTVGMLSAGTIVNAEEGYVVKEGDNLKKIAKEVYGDSSAWRAIYDANKASIKNPNIIYKGQVLHIPNGTSEAPSVTEEAVPAAPEQTQIETAPVSEQEIPAVVTETQGMTLPYFKIIQDAEITNVSLKLQYDTSFFNLDSFVDFSAGINGKEFIINNLNLPDNYLGVRQELNDFSIPFGLEFDFEEGIIYSPETEDYIPSPITFEPDGGVILNYNGSDT